MLKKRIIFTLIYADGYFHQSRNFTLQKVGDIGWLENNYQFQKTSFSIDELVVLNASRQQKDITSFSKVVSRLARNVFIPVAAGGGVTSIRDAEELFSNGADKLVVNSVCFNDPKFVKKLIAKYGAQSILASVDYKGNSNNNLSVYINNATQKIEFLLQDYIYNIESLGVGEIYLNSIDKDGTGFGYDFVNLDQINVMLPLIIAGGAGHADHFVQALSNLNVSAVATANLFNFIGDGLEKARQRLLESNVNIVDRSPICCETNF